jgi:CheY-like chemotaxis protein
VTLDLKHITLLVVEDIPSMRELTVSMLTTLEPKKILTAAGGERAVGIFYRHKPDVVITDWDMEPVDGIHLTRLIRSDPLSHNRKTPVILTTSFSDNDHMSIARDAGVTEYLIKPFSAKDLATRLDAILNHPRPFIDVPSYFGPERRRRTSVHYKGLLRREADKSAAAEPEVRAENHRVKFVDQPGDMHWSKLRVLFVEDNPGVCLITKTILLNAGITQVFVSHDGKKALEFLDAAPDLIDIILCDWEMPHVTGLELLRQVRTAYPDMPFIMLTGRADLESLKIAMESGVDSYIKKPVSLDNLKKNIAKAILRKRKAS